MMETQKQIKTVIDYEVMSNAGRYATTPDLHCVVKHIIEYFGKRELAKFFGTTPDEAKNELRRHIINRRNQMFGLNQNEDFLNTDIHAADKSKILKKDIPLQSAILSDKVYNKDATELLQLIPKKEWDRVSKSPGCEIGPDFLGFIHTYKSLSELIPEDWTVIDFGPAYNTQSYYFRNHKRYIAVEPSKQIEMFQPDNCDIYRCTTREFIKNHLLDAVNDEKVFAICNYVPNWYSQDSIRLVKEKFRYCFTYYPEK